MRRGANVYWMRIARGAALAKGFVEHKSVWGIQKVGDMRINKFPNVQQKQMTIIIVQILFLIKKDPIIGTQRIGLAFKVVFLPRSRFASRDKSVSHMNVLGLQHAKKFLGSNIVSIISPATMNVIVGRYT